MTHPFTDHLGRARQLFKHKRALAAFKAGELTAAELAQKPWFLRVQTGGTETTKSLGTSDTREALRLARDLCRQADGSNAKLAEFMGATAQKGQLTCAGVAQDYVKAGYPDRTGTPRQGRSLRQARNLMRAVLDYFGNRPVVSITRADQQLYLDHVLARVAARLARDGAHGMPQSGVRIAESELMVLSNALEWAADRGRIALNPLIRRKRFHDPKKLHNHKRYQPTNADELHALARWMIDAGNPVQAARVLYHALSGQRPGEAEALRWHHAGMMEGTPGFRWTGLPASLGDNSGGQRAELMCVHREKNGVNAAVVVRPALAEFLDAWRSWSEAQFGDVNGKPMFPVNNNSRMRLSTLLNTATQALGSPRNRFKETRRTAHALRAYYVTVRRAQGAADALIATELGHGTGAQMVMIYGENTDATGNDRFGWLPSNGQPPAWEAFLHAANFRLVPFAPARAAVSAAA